MLYHITNKKNLKSILEKGLLLSKARNKHFPYVWVTTEVTDDLLNHVSKNHRWKKEKLIVIVLNTNLRNFFVRHPNKVSRTGFVYKTKRDIPPHLIHGVDYFQLGATPSGSYMMGV